MYIVFQIIKNVVRRRIEYIKNFSLSLMSYVNELGRAEVVESTECPRGVFTDEGCLLQQQGPQAKHTSCFVMTLHRWCQKITFLYAYYFVRFFFLFKWGILLFSSVLLLPIPGLFLFVIFNQTGWSLSCLYKRIGRPSRPYLYVAHKHTYGNKTKCVY